MKKTILHDWHVRSGARMAEFAGYDMPISYDSITGGMKNEHLHVRSKAGMFDVSHMGEFRIKGPGAVAFLNLACTRPVDALAVGRAQYALLLNASGGIVDDIIVYRIAEQEFFMVVNAANIAKDFGHLSSVKSGFDCELTDESESWALIAVQGPTAISTLSKRFSKIEELKYYGFRAESDLILSRTGYTGEDGLEIFLRPNKALELWEWLAAEGVWPIGLGARDSLRLEVCFPLYGHELSDGLFPGETLASFAVSKKAPSFLGANKQPTTLKSQPICLLGESPKPMRAGEKIYLNDQLVGEITSGSYSPILKKGMGVGLVSATLDLSRADDGFIWLIESGGKKREATKVEAPFVETSRVKRRSATPPLKIAK